MAWEANVYDAEIPVHIMEYKKIEYDENNPPTLYDIFHNFWNQTGNQEEFIQQISDNEFYYWRYVGNDIFDHRFVKARLERLMEQQDYISKLVELRHQSIEACGLYSPKLGELLYQAVDDFYNLFEDLMDYYISPLDYYNKRRAQSEAESLTNRKVTYKQRLQMIQEPADTLAKQIQAKSKPQPKQPPKPRQLKPYEIERQKQKEESLKKKQEEEEKERKYKEQERLEQMKQVQQHMITLGIKSAQMYKREKQQSIKELAQTRAKKLKAKMIKALHVGKD